MYRSLVGFSAKAPDPPTTRDLCWALAADTEALRADRQVWPAAVRAEPATVFLQVLAAKLVPRRRGADQSVRLRFRLLSGPGTPAVFEAVWSLKFCTYAAATVFGFAGRPRPGRPPSGHRYRHHRQLVGCRFRARVRQTESRVELEELAGPSACTEWNAALGDMRARTSFTCPFAFDHHCHDCPKGQTSCPAACRPLDLVDAPCPVCRLSATLDPAWGGLCRSCEDPSRKKE